MADSSDSTAAPRKKAFVQTEERKQQHVSHWDQDYLSREELDAEMGDKPEADGTPS